MAINQRAALVATVAGLLLLPAAALAEQVKPLMAQDLAGLAGKEGVVLTVSYKPGEASSAHRHNAHVFVYMLEGSVVMQVEGGKPVTLKPGQTFYENPSDVHSVSRNASKTKPAKFLVVLIKDKSAPPVMPAK